VISGRHPEDDRALIELQTKPPKWSSTSPAKPATACPSTRSRSTRPPSPAAANPPKACVVPRPIGWISTTTAPPPRAAAAPSAGGADAAAAAAAPQHNLAPFSQFNNLTYDPPYVMFAANQNPRSARKDTVANAEAAGFFGWSLATYALREAVNASAEFVPAHVDEFERAGLRKAFGRVFPALPLVAASPVRFECAYHATLRLPGNPPMGSVDVVIGRVVGVHVEEWALTGGKVDVRKTRPIARCGYYEYAVVEDTFEMVIPGDDEALLAGLEGSVKRTRELPAVNGAKDVEQRAKEEVGQPDAGTEDVEQRDATG
jgi:flavin reductase (DIM6/NTAB) family NADH-FMN oxidoreductase RutF